MEDINNALSLPLNENAEKQKEAEPAAEKIVKTNINIDQFLNTKKERDIDPKNEDVPMNPIPVKKPTIDLSKLTPKTEDNTKKGAESIDNNKEVIEPSMKVDTPPEVVIKEAEAEIKKPQAPTPTTSQIIENLANINKSNDITNQPISNQPILKSIQNSALPLLVPPQTVPPLVQQSNPNEPLPNNSPINPVPNAEGPPRKMLPFSEAKKEIDDFTLFLDNVAKGLKEKYSITFPEYNYEDALPDDLKIKLLESYFDSPEIKELLKKAVAEKPK